MRSGFIRHLSAKTIAVAFIGAAVVSLGDTAAVADPGQDQKFFDLLGQKDIPPVDNANSLIETAHKACAKLDSGMSSADLVDLIRNNGYNENPLTRLNDPGRITRTIDQFINASVEAYCPYDRVKIAGLVAYHPLPVTARRVALTSLVGTLPAGDIAPTKPLPVPAQPPPVPQEIQPAPQEPPPPPRRVQKAPQQAPPKQVEPPPEEAPPPEPAPPPEAPAPAAPAPPPPEPAPPTPDRPVGPGHVRLAP